MTEINNMIATCCEALSDKKGFDIKILDEKGEKVEIAAPVDVRIDLADKEMLKKAGFLDIEVYSDFEDYHEKCERLIFICKKEAH